jgi:hypothetical protein
MTNQDHVSNILDDVLVLLSGQGFPTPERTYKLDGGWGLALSDLRRCFDQYRARIADLEAERDAAKAGEAGYTPQQIAEYAIYLKASRDVLEERKKWLGAEETHETTNE